ncbi:hypothetical protein [Agarivorans gilvus]|uniref:DUF3828 domain-containing protein n=1 Tax=Agarivorans gilvus TaxID=680279 RepID=A0ABQ1I7N6_9ALTE|nr:hypothetical protein [Agarivorans gilvus]GGB21946.1 hypothetical protein GCM10007414_39190 [Agarivorans gilvus]
MKKLLIILGLVSSFSAHTGELQQAFESLLGSKGNQALVSENAQKIIAEAEKYPDEQVMQDIVSFPNGLKLNEQPYLEKITGDKGCLVVMGNLDRPPYEIADYSVQYAKQGENWIVDDFRLHYYFEGEPRFLTEAICDPEKVNEAWANSLDGE